MTPPELESVYREYSGKVMGYIISHVRSREDAEDLCADVFEKILRKLDGYDQDKAALGTWIYTITRNTVIDYFRKTRPTAELDENITSDATADESLLNQETLSELAAALRQLPEDQRAIITLVYYDGKPMTEVAAALGLSYGAVKLRHQKALATLKRQLTAE